jgi:sulfur carrier protein ThiS
MQIKFINGAGRGFASDIEVAEGTTVAQLFANKVGGSAAAWTIKLNGELVTAEQIVQDGDSLAITKQGSDEPLPLSEGDDVTVAPANIKGN